MNILLDTEVLLWAQADSPKLTDRVRALLTADTVFKWLTPVSYLEIAIKHKIGKLPEIGLQLVDFFEQVQQDGYQLLPLRTEHIIAYDQIPFFEDHHDPFDRLILATALHEGWPVMSADRTFSWYKDQIEVIR